MQGERGVGVAIVTIGVGLFVILVAGAYLLTRGGSAPDAGTATTTAPQATVTTDAAGNLSYAAIPLSSTPSYRSMQQVDARTYKDASGVYVNTAAKPDAAPQFVKFDVPKPLAMQRVAPAPELREAPDSRPGLPVTSAPAPSNPPAYYQDGQSVYVLNPAPSTDMSSQSTTTVQQSLAQLAGADPATFQLLGDQYAKDANNVYVIVTTCTTNNTCTETLQVIPGADPATFQEYVTSIVNDPSAGGPVVIDGSDVNNLYYDGQVVASNGGNVLQTIRAYGTPSQNGLIWIP